MQLTRIRGASSAARDRVRPSTAPFAAAILAWNGRPVWTATVEKNTTEEFPLCFNAGRACLISRTAPMRFTDMSARKSWSLRR